MGHWESWRESVRRNPPDALGDARVEEMFLKTTQYGSLNCWTGTAGGLAAMVRQLIAELERLLSELEKRSYD